VLALLLAAGTAVNTAVGYVPNVSAARMLLTGYYRAAHTGGGRITARIIRAPARLRMPVSATWVYTPPGYHAGGSVRYPVVYLLHGTPGQSADWFAAGDVASVMDVLIAGHLVRPMIIVSPDVNGRGQDDTECLDSAHGGSQVETYLSTVVVPWVDTHYRTVADWPHRAIGGMSSGGFCALDQGLRHPELYGSIIALEPYDNPGAGGRAMLRTQAQYDARSPGHYLPTMTFAHPVATFLDIGSLGGGDGSQTARTAAQLTARKQEVGSRVEPNQGHDWTMARTGIPYGLVFVSHHMPA
jgi:enterochelin esterase-like enzyme